MATTDSNDTPRLGTAAYVIGGMSFIPLIGVLFGIAAIVWGLVTKKLGGKRLAAIGAGGIAFTLVLYGALFYFGFAQRGGVYDELRVQLAQGTINSLVPSIEFYKTQNGKYPESLKVLQDSLPKEGFVSVFDPSALDLGAQPRYFFYQRVGEDHYYLRGLGADGKPFTPDDIVPQFPAVPGSKSGLLVERRSDS
ncbi:MAG: type II secretion system protein G [Gammaproteobacteria bacterium]|nr:MAG: type II secretion system protein G [Gammaproteobacteria bacterium]